MVSGISVRVTDDYIVCLTYGCLGKIFNSINNDFVKQIKKHIKHIPQRIQEVVI